MEKILIQNYDKIYPYSVARKEILQYWHDQAWLINRPYFFEIRDRVLYLYKNIYFQRYIFLAMPPMTLDCDYEKEYDLMINSEYDCVFSDEFINNINDPLDYTDLQLKGRNEYIYNTETYLPENMTGKKNRKWRNAVNKLANDGYVFEFLEYDDSDIFLGNYFINDLVPNMTRLTKEWVVQKDKNDSTKFFWIELLSHLKGSRILTLKDSNNNLVGYNITHHIGNTIIYSCEKFLEHEFNNFPVLKAVHIKLSDYWRNELGSEFYMNKGNSLGESGLQDNKKLLRPSIIMPLYKIYKNG